MFSFWFFQFSFLLELYEICLNRAKDRIKLLSEESHGSAESKWYQTVFLMSQTDILYIKVMSVGCLSHHRGNLKKKTSRKICYSNLSNGENLPWNSAFKISYYLAINNVRHSFFLTLMFNLFNAMNKITHLGSVM